MKMLDYLSRQESKTLEFKQDLSSSQTILKTLIAFANSSGGTLVIGVKDRTREVIGVSNDLNEEEKHTNWISDSIAPRLTPDVEIRAWRSVQLLVVHVFPSSLRPHYLKRNGPEYGTYVRVGSTNRRADSALITSLRRSVLAHSYDEEPLPNLNSEAIDFRLASELFKDRRLSMGRKEMLSIGALVRVQGKEVPTVGGLLLFGMDPSHTFPDAWLQCGRFDGDTKADIIDHIEIRKPLPCLVDDGMAFVQKHALRGMVLDGIKRKDRWSVPMDAVREALINSLVHADYSLTGVPLRVSIFNSSIVIENPGFLLPGLTVEDMLSGISRLRNRVLGRVFSELGLVEQWGSGIPRILKTCEKAGLPKPEFREIATGFQVRLKIIPERSVDTDTLNQSAMEFIRSKKNGASTAEIAKYLKISARAVRSRLKELRDRGLVHVVGRNERDPKRRYFTTDR